MKNFKEKIEIDDDIEDLNLDDFEEESGEEALVDLDNIKHIVYPLYHQFPTKLQERHNPLYIMKQKVVYLFNPKSTTSIYTPVNPKMLTIEQLASNFISLKNKNDFLKTSNKSLSIQMKSLYTNIAEFVDSVNKEIAKDGNKNNPKNKFKKRKKY